jgi:hypothetical protein
MSQEVLPKDVSREDLRETYATLGGRELHLHGLSLQRRIELLPMIPSR